MIAEWMLYCALWAVWLSAATWVVERLLLRGRGPARVAWIACLVLSVAGPLFGYVVRRADPPRVDQAVATSGATMAQTVVVRASASIPIAGRSTIRETVLPSLDRPLALGWASLSVAALLYIAAGAIYLGAQRRRWRAATVDNARVMISRDVGPALVGMIRSTIVLPEWVLGLEPENVSLILRHELEHQSAGDGRVVALAQLALVLMPWNPMIWWQLRRLRLAIELDCDARVLRGAPDVRSYGRLLLEVGRPRRGFHFAGAALSDHAPELEQRIRMMTRRPTMGRLRSAAMSTAVGSLAVAIGCQMPAPALSVPPGATSLNRASASAPVSHNDSIVGAVVARLRSSTTGSDSIRRADAVHRVRSDTLPTNRASWLDMTSAELHRIGAAIYSGPTALPAEFEYPTDSAAALRGHPECSASAEPADAALIRLLVVDSLAERDGRIEINSTASAAGTGRVSVELTDSTSGGHDMRCSLPGAGTLRLYGRGALDGSGGRTIVVRADMPAMVAVATGSGRVIAGPTPVSGDGGHYRLAWKATPR